MSYSEEVADWDIWLAGAIGPDIELVSVSVHSSDCRIYRNGPNVWKVRRLTPASCRNRANFLEDEFLILASLNSIREAPKPVQYFRQGEWESFEMTSLPALRVTDPTFGHPKESLRDFLAVAGLTFRMNRLGCSHGDLHRQNVGRNCEGTLSIFDFDQAVIGNPFRCWLRDFFGVGAYARMSDVSLFRRAADVAWLSFAAKALRALFNGFASPFRGLKRSDDSMTSLVSRARLTGNPNLVSLAEAWTLAARSKASSPDAPCAYYSLDISGVNFPGERPWMLRWEHLKRAVDFEGKRFLELGCNLGLLSTHARLNGASYCLGLDIDSDILSAAQTAAAALGADVKFIQQNLDSTNDWENDLSGFDLVSALSVLHWVSDKDRVWRFLANHREVLYEGHESSGEAVARLRALGFTQVSVLTLSDRGRELIHAVK